MSTRIPHSVLNLKAGVFNAQPRLDSTPQCVNGMRYSYPRVECGTEEVNVAVLFERTESRTGSWVVLELSFRITVFFGLFPSSSRSRDSVDSVAREILRILWNPEFITVFTKPRRMTLSSAI